MLDLGVEQRHLHGDQTREVGGGRNLEVWQESAFERIMSFTRTAL
jgi:hypothetical protein